MGPHVSFCWSKISMLCFSCLHSALLFASSLCILLCWLWSFLNFQRNEKGGSPVLLSLPFCDHPPHWWNPAGQHSGRCHLFKVCHLALVALSLGRADTSHAATSTSLSSSLCPPSALSWSESIWDGAEICQAAQAAQWLATEPGTAPAHPTVINLLHFSSPRGSVGKLESLFSISTHSDTVKLLDREVSQVNKNGWGRKLY